MNWRMFARIGMALLFLAMVVAVGVGAYNLGVSQGLLLSDKVVVTDPSTVPYMFGPLGWRPYGWGHPFGFGFGFLGCLIPFFGFFLLFGLLRALFWRRWAWGHHGPHGHPGGPRMHGPWAEHMRNTFNEWHQQAHQAQPEPQTPPATTPPQ